MNKIKTKISNKSLHNLLIFVIFLSLSIISIYFTTIYKGQIAVGNDTNFHTLRIEDYSLAIKAGKLYPYINKIALYGAGYAAPLFYSNFFLFPIAFVHAAGFPLASSIIVYLIFLNLITFYISYYSFKSCISNRNSAFIFSIFYTISTYRLVEITPRFAIGELLALTFMPLAFAGLYKIVNQHKNGWTFLALGMSGIVLSHHISAMIFALLILFWIIFYWKYIDKQVWINFLKATCLSFLLTAFYLIPLVEQLASQNFYLQTHPAFDISSTGIPIGTLIIDALKFNNLSIITIGFLTPIILLISWLSIKIFTWNQRKITIIATIFLILTTTLAPWEILAKTPLSYLQFPWRLFSIVSLLVAWLVADISQNISFDKQLILPIIPVIIMLITQISGNQILYKKSYSEYNMVYVSRNGIQGAEFLPNSLDENLLSQVQASHPATKDGYNLKFEKSEFVNTSDVTLPVIWYKGYQVIDSQNHEINFTESHGLIKLKKQPTSDIYVKYKGTALQKTSLFISIFSLLIFIFKYSKRHS